MYNKNKDQIENREKFYGNYRGRVVDVDDPYRSGRIRVEIFSVFDDLPIDALPWAIYADTLMGGQEEIGSFIVPDLNSHVWVFFEEGDHTQPVYFAGAPARPHGPPQSDNGEYPRNKAFRTMAGHYIEFDDTPGDTRIKLYHTSGTETEIDHEGNVDQYVVSNVTQLIDENVTQTVKGNVTQTVEGNVDQTVKGNVDRLIEGNLTEDINGNYTRNIGGSASDSISGSYTRSTSGSVDESAGSGMTFTAPRIDLN